MGWRRGADGAWPGRGEGSGVGGTVVPCSVPTYSPKLGWDGPRMAPLCPPPGDGVSHPHTSTLNLAVTGMLPAEGPR